MKKQSNWKKWAIKNIWKKSKAARENPGAALRDMSEAVCQQEDLRWQELNQQRNPPLSHPYTSLRKQAHQLRPGPYPATTYLPQAACQSGARQGYGAVQSSSSDQLQYSAVQSNYLDSAFHTPYKQR